MQFSNRTICADTHTIRSIFFGFSLIELLVVISIIAAVLAILVPGLGKARSVARRIICKANLKQIDIAMHSYINTNDDTFPCAGDPISADPFYWLWMGRGWRQFIAPHLDGSIDANNPSVLLCPSDQTAPEKWESTSYSYSMAFYHSPEQINDMNSISDTFNNPKPSIPQRPVNVIRPGGKIIVGEWLSNHRQVEQTDDGWWCWLGRRNYLFVDGQVRFLDADEISPANDGYPNPNLTKNGIKGSDWPR